MLKAQRGRPRKGTRAPGSSPRSVRFTDETWLELERRAKRRGITLHALLREVIADWLTKAA
jgi:predicted DNA-binding ribbon-helix-helix protein